jgi:hypothetical protein
MHEVFKSTLALMATFVAASPGDAQERVSWKQYVDESGTRIAFPVSVFPNDGGPTEQGIGRQFRTADTRAQLAIYSLSNPKGERPAGYLRNHLKVSPATIKYARVTPRFYVLSSVRDGFIYYSRCNFARRIHCIYMTYPEHEKRAWDEIVTRVSNSLRASG